MDESLLKYKKPYFFKNFRNFEDYLDEQLSIHIQDEDLLLLKKSFDKNCLTPDFVISKMKQCKTSALTFYARYLFFNFKIDGLKILVSRFNEEQDEEKKLIIYNCMRPLGNYLNCQEIFELIDEGVLSILVGEYARKTYLSFVEINFSNVYLKFLGYYTFEEMESMSMDELEEYIKKDVNIIKIIAMCTVYHSNLEKVLRNDTHSKCYLENCKVNLNLLKKLKFKYDPYTSYLVFDKIKDDEMFCTRYLSELTPEARTYLSI
ncbi:hypothetical protein NBO_54g0002 [Nosema bombycis CQ1]|uniref:Uncharacterized protein n=1 Tax=Nosema bombycis (strain CQ1 / CVCC 102059) TaxID=578461 RepID=R0KSW8_NOSB1|nr:hypothetical protein NBO_54g0002 [Nosema bombycis CQ1]|eukprot:EOB13856.1 hypothetical protein NBO_54g0002 [Nosema bombycis CQ1]